MSTVSHDKEKPSDNGMKMNWKSGAVVLGKAEASQPVWRLTCAGDWAAKSDWGEERLLEKRLIEQPESVYGELLPILRDSDLRIVNVETVVADCGQPLAAKAVPERYLIRAREEAIAGLTAVPFDVACLANNHTMDFGEIGLERTIQVLEQAGVRTVGAGTTAQAAEATLHVEVKGIPVGIINVAEGEQCRSIDGGPGAHGLELDAVRRRISEVKQTGAVAIVIFHGGREHVPAPPEYVARDLRAIAAMGAAAVIAHHPHVPQGIEIVGGVPIVYSLGNFVFWQNSPAFYRHCGYVLHLNFSGRTMTGLEITPYVVRRTGIERMGARMRQKFAEDMERVSAVLAHDEALRAVWDAVADEMSGPVLAKALQDGAAGWLEGDPGRTARLCNLFFTPAHRELYISALRRSVEGRLGDSPLWARELVDHWLNYPLAEAEALDECVRGERRSEDGRSNT